MDTASGFSGDDWKEQDVSIILPISARNHSLC